jgi:translation initiation factor 2A
MRVDNGTHIYKYNGLGPMVSNEITELHEAMWRPAPPGLYPDRPQSPKLKGAAAEQVTHPACVYFPVLMK